MLFVQDISLTYYKDVRYANYANARNEIKFAPVKIEKIPDCEVFYQKVGMFQDIDGIKKSKAYFEEYGEEILNPEKYIVYCNSFLCNTRIFKTGDTYKIRFCDDRYFTSFHRKQRRGHNEEFTNHRSSFCYKDIINETAFNLRPDEYGRIIFNERYAEFEGKGKWYYLLNTINFINCDKSKFREKMFYRKVPDYEYKNMQYLKYC